MRDIKFRFWSPDNMMISDHNEWCEGTGINEALKASAEYDYKIMQFTGLTDKNGKEIYEGDIIKTKDKFNPIYVMKSIIPWPVLEDSKGCDYDNGDYYSGYDVQCHPWSSFEVIGNIYENPELLESES